MGIRKSYDLYAFIRRKQKETNAEEHTCETYPTFIRIYSMCQIKVFRQIFLPLPTRYYVIRIISGLDNLGNLFKFLCQKDNLVIVNIFMFTALLCYLLGRHIFDIDFCFIKLCGLHKFTFIKFSFVSENY